MKTYAQVYPVQAFIDKWLKDPLQSFIREHPIHLPFGRKQGHVWMIKHIGWITYYWDLGEYSEKKFPRPENIGNWSPKITVVKK